MKNEHNTSETAPKQPFEEAGNFFTKYINARSKSTKGRYTEQFETYMEQWRNVSLKSVH